MAKKHIDRAALIATIRELKELSNEQKSDILQLISEQKKYGIVWEDSPEEVEENLRVNVPVLVEDKDRAIVSNADDAPNHILIEGDNLEALTALSYTHEGKIDVIYIDPPYNRGEEDFKYNDKFIDKENPFRHSLWMSFMKKRLSIAKRLLSDTGVIITHIDEHEFDALNILLETEVFSEKSNLGVIVWNKLNPKGDPHAVSVMHEYILIFCKNKDAFIQQNGIFTIKKTNAKKIIDKAKLLFNKIGKKAIPDDVNEIIKKYKLPKDIKNLFAVEYDLETVNKEFATWLKKSNFKDGEKAYCFIDENGDCFQPVSMAWPNKETPSEDYFVPLIHPVNNKPCPVPTKGWRNPTSTMIRMQEGDVVEILPNMVCKGQIVFTTRKNGQNNQPRRKYLLKDNLTENTPSIYNDGSSDDDLLLNLGISFPYPKTISVAKYLLSSIHPDPKIVLDFFAGSGTTLHATMELNAVDGKRRQCILVTNNESNICEDVTYIRSFKIINGYTTPKGVEVEGLHNNSLRYYKIKDVPRDSSTTGLKKLMLASTDLLCIKNDLYEEQSEFGNIKLRKNIARYFDDGKQKMLIIYKVDAIESIVEEIKKMPDDTFIKVYVFSTNNYAMDADFEEVSDKVFLCALPAAIYNAYRKVLPRKNNVITEEEEE